MSIHAVWGSIYVACLSSYNAGHLHGVWIDIDDIDEMRSQIGDMLKASPVAGAEEWAIHDSEHVPAGKDLAWYARVSDLQFDHELAIAMAIADGDIEEDKACDWFVVNSDDDPKTSSLITGGTSKWTTMGKVSSISCPTLTKIIGGVVRA